jgi:hypothetical protein
MQPAALIEPRWALGGVNSLILREDDQGGESVDSTQSLPDHVLPDSRIWRP